MYTSSLHQDHHSPSLSVIRSNSDFGAVTRMAADLQGYIVISPTPTQSFDEVYVDSLNDIHLGEVKSPTRQASNRSLQHLLELHRQHRARPYLPLYTDTSAARVRVGSGSRLRHIPVLLLLCFSNHIPLVLEDS